MVTGSRNLKRNALPPGERKRGVVIGGAQVIPLPSKQAPQDGVVLTPAQRRSRRARSIAIALVLGGLALLFYAVTIVKLGPGVLNRPL